MGNPLKELLFGVSWVLGSEVIDRFTSSRARPAIFMEPVGSFDDLSTDTAWLGFDPTLLLLLSLLENSQVLTAFHVDSLVGGAGSRNSL